MKRIYNSFKAPDLSKLKIKSQKKDEKGKEKALFLDKTKPKISRQKFTLQN
jgi:hypothetical protein